MLKFIKITNKDRHIDWIIANAIFKGRAHRFVQNGKGLLYSVVKDEFVAAIFKSDIYV